MIIRIDLQQLRCDSQSDDDGARPYLWTELLQIDDDTLAPNGALVAAVDFPPSPIGARTLIQEKMKAGDSAPIPEEFARLAARFREGLMRRDLIFVALLWDQHDTPGAAMVAGYNVFLSELRDAVADNLGPLSTATGPAQDTIIQIIKKRIHDKVETAISDEVSALDKAGIFVGLESSDRLIDSAFSLFAQQNASMPFTLTFHDASDDFKLDAQLVVTVDQCEDELIQVNVLQQEIATMEGALKQLANAHGGDPRPEDEKNMERIEKDLGAAQGKLKVAQDAYERCRLLHGPLKQ